ncbi:MAG: lamin tail domain-containing protein [Planctomycetes bacterium]|nr:lamin tail domain-containing protein [Planctomycetota bacterium]
MAGSSGLEFVEIYNPTAAAIDLSDYYLTDGTNTTGGNFYWKVAAGQPLASGPAFTSDFHARFPGGARIGAGEFQTVVIGEADVGGVFQSTYGADPDYELATDADGIGDMREVYPGSMNGTSVTLTDSGETVILYRWDAKAALVEDVDQFSWGDGVTRSNPTAVDKTGVSSGASTYKNDTPLARQKANRFTPAFVHTVQDTYQRVDYKEGVETRTGGNGLQGHDETSEDLDQTWTHDRFASPGSIYPALTPAAGATAVAAGTTVETAFLQAMDVPTLKATSLVLKDAQGNLVPGAVSYDATGNRLVLRPTAALAAGGAYTAVLSRDVKRAGGKTFLPIDLDWSFTVAGGAAPAAPTVIINEYLADPNSDVNGDGKDGGDTQEEFVELVNASAASADISGWVLSDGFAARHTFAQGTVLPAGQAIVVFAGGTPTGFARAVTATSGGLNLNNSGDTLKLADAAGSLVSTVAFGTARAGISGTRTKDGDPAASFADHDTLPSGLKHSAGKRSDGTAF